MVTLEEFLQKGEHQINIGYAKGDSIPAHMYRFLLKKRFDTAEKKGLIANYEIAEGFELNRLDIARKAQGVTLCCISSDTITPAQVDKICKDHYFSQKKRLNEPDRDFFTQTMRNDTRNYIPKNQAMILSQNRMLYSRYRYQHEDFVLVFTHSRMMEAHISSTYYYNHLMIDI
jgi:hypothetical protein